MAANVDPAEADLTADGSRRTSWPRAPGNPSPTGCSAGAAPQTPEAREQSQRIWWYLLLLGTVLLAADTLVSNRLENLMARPPSGRIPAPGSGVS